MHTKIGILATGNEIVNGDILNTNAQNIAQSLFQHHIPVGKHVIVTDDQPDLLSGLNYLLQDHHVVITTGGLGPTSDDRTRYAISSASDKNLLFDDNTWAAITKRILAHTTDTTVPENNKKQALFPEGSIIYPNPNGTACGCMCRTANGKIIFMLPGPPSECLPMFNQYVLPYLLDKHCNKETYFKKWLLFGVSEGHIAEKIDKLTEKHQRTTGYRIAYPYLECKLLCDNQQDFEALIPIIEKEISPHIIGDGHNTASKQLHQLILKNKTSLNINDQATGGMLSQKLLTPSSYQHISFDNNNSGILITGLTEYWQEMTPSVTQISLEVNGIHQTLDIPLRGSRTRLYATEAICIALLNTLYG